MADSKAFKIDLIVKFGGSAITHKEQLETVNLESLQAATRIVQQCVALNLACVIVHGAGSFGHHQAKKYKVNEGYTRIGNDEKQSRKTGFCLTRLSVTKLNHIVVDSLASATIPAVGLPGLGNWTTHDATVIKHNLEGIKHLIQNGFVPVLHGDCVLDTQKGFNILSGDDIIMTLCRELPVKRTVFLADVQGIYDKPPAQEGAKLLSKLAIHKDGTITQDIHTSTSSCDVTGGIKHKLETAKDIVLHSKQNTEVFVCRVTDDIAKSLCCHENNYIHDDSNFTQILSHTS